MCAATASNFVPRSEEGARPGRVMEISSDLSSANDPAPPFAQIAADEADCADHRTPPSQPTSRRHPGGSGTTFPGVGKVTHLELILSLSFVIGLEDISPFHALRRRKSFQKASISTGMF